MPSKANGGARGRLRQPRAFWRGPSPNRQASSEPRGNRMNRVLLAVGLLLLVMSLAAPAISAQGNANVSNRIRGSMKLRSASPDQARHISGPARTATAKALREHGYLVRNQAAYDRAK